MYCLLSMHCCLFGLHWAALTAEDLPMCLSTLAWFVPFCLQVVEHDGLPYYMYELTRHRLVAATATGGW